MAYKSLYRKYRPTNFEDVCGQEFITKTLNNAITKGKISHAYLFNGTRGTGKTTIAKIFARTVNCLHPIENGLPCGKCDICKTENTDEIQDIIEIDAASNNGVDEIRELKNRIKLVPVLCKYKVYIIDEVHMLSTGAFNALLKTLEEPPEHAIFILATTEPQKLPITIISRCQRFDFKKICISDIVKRLKYIADSEKIKISDDCLEEIAKMSDGAMRDAIGLLDQVSLFTDGKITLESLYSVSGNVPYITLCELIENYLNGNITDVLQLIETLYNEGKDFNNIGESVLMLFRNILISKKAPIYFEKIDHPVKEWIINVSKNIDEKRLNTIIENLDSMLKSMKNSNYPRIQFELFILNDNNIDIKKNTEEIKVKKEVVKEIKVKAETKPEVEKEKIDFTVIQNEYSNETRLSIESGNYEDKKALINNTIALASAKSKKVITEYLNDLDKYLISKKYKVAATVLKDAVVSAASEDYILLTYKYDSMVDSNDNELKKIVSLFKEISGNSYKIVAITEDEWKEVRPYYVNLKKEKGKIDLIDESTVVIEESSATKEFADVIDVFGTDLVEMEG